MKIVFNNTIPFDGFKAITIYPFIFVRDEYRFKFNVVDINHENIHAQQQCEVFAVSLVLLQLLWVLGAGMWSFIVLPMYFYLYILEYIIKLVYYRSSNMAYRAISFEQEAYDNEYDLKYIRNSRQFFSWVRFILNNPNKPRGTELNMDDF